MRYHLPRVARAMLLCASVLVAGTTSPANVRELPQALAAVGAPNTTPSTTPAAPEDIQGAGRYQEVACWACAAAVLGLGGASVAGLFYLAAFLPDAVAGCVTICAIAYSM